MDQRLQNNSGAQTRINPVSSALAAAKPIRDPRLLRQQQQKHVADDNGGDSQQSNNSSLGAQLGQKNLDNNSNKFVTNSKIGIKDVRKDPRMSNSYNNNKFDSSKPSKPSKSRSQTNDDINHGKKSQNRSTHKSAGTDSDKSSKSSSTSSLDSPTKNKSTSISKRNKKRDKPSSLDDGINASSVKSAKREKLQKRESPILRENLPKTTDVPSSDDTFKGVKSSTKNRNYIRRNLSESPELPPQDEDLRAFTTPPEKHPRLNSDTVEPQVPVTAPVVNAVDIETPVPKTMDVDLRQLPAVITTKKRNSTEVPEASAPKKSKIFDVLFGNEDTDLRQLSAPPAPANVDRPPTPPPPIISSSSLDVSTTKSKEATKNTSNFEAIRAKLANATNKEKIMSKSFHKKKLQQATNEDQDLRVPTVSSSTDIPRNTIIISPDDEKIIKSGDMTKEQQASLLNKIFMQIEKGKLREAKQKDHENSIGNISLQPISDDEFDIEESKAANNVSNSDKDERIHVMPHHHSHMESMSFQPPPQQQFYPRDQRMRFPMQPWRGGGPVGNWRGRGRGMVNPPMMPMSRPPLRPRIGAQPWRNFQQHHDDDSNSGDVTVDRDRIANVELLESAVSRLNIDGSPKDIRFYDETAVIFLNWDNPREIGFQPGSRRVVFNEQDVYVLNFDDAYKECLINGVSHRIKLGAPSKEIFIDGVGYECIFGGSSICVTNADGESFTVKLEGPIPTVKISDVKRTDLVAGKISMIINANLIVPVFLDAKLQKFVIDGETSTLRFVDALKTVLINEIPHSIEFGAIPKPYTIHGKKHFIRFSVLPKGIRPGHVRIKDMDGPLLADSPRCDDNSTDGASVDMVEINDDSNHGVKRKRLTGTESPDARSNSPSFFQNLLQPNLNNLDVLSNVLSSSLDPAPSTSGYQVGNIPNTTEAQTSNAHNTIVPPPMPSTLNINDLFQKLVATGIVKSELAPVQVPIATSTEITKQAPSPVNNASSSSPVKPATSKRNILDTLKPVVFGKPETFKIRQAALYLALYSGLQCSSCGMRFPPESTVQYSQHLDWHFRQNRRGKKNIRVASSRKWYYSVADWKNYEEIEDLEEREKNYFDQQQQAETVSEDTEEEAEIPSVTADPTRTDEKCEVCRDKFEQFFHEEREEWHLKNAIEVDGKTYHPICYDDYQQSILECSVDESKVNQSEADKPAENAIIPGLEIILDDDDDDLPTDQPEVVSLDDDETLPLEERENDEQLQEDDDDDDDDVILNEVAPIKIVVEDDEDDDHHAEKTLQKPEAKIETRVKRERHVDDDGFVDVGEGMVSLNKVGQIKIKSEPIDHDESLLAPVDSSMEEPKDDNDDISEVIPTTHQQVIMTIDGNSEIVSDNSLSSNLSCVNRIKINISKPLTNVQKEKQMSPANVADLNVDESELSNEEPEIVQFKPALQGVKLRKLPKVRKGSELTGMCSIM